MAKVTIPATLEEATTALEGLGKLLTAKSWERAAIIYAFTRDGRKRTDTDIRKTVTEFVRLGISGLTTGETVSIYRQNWLAGDGDPDIKPGQTVTLPTIGWPPRWVDPATGEAEKARGYISEEGLATTLARAVEKHGAATVTKALFNTAPVDELAADLDDQTVRRINATAGRHHDEPREVTERPRPTIDWDRQYQEAASDIVNREADKLAGRWTPNEQTEFIRHFLVRALNASTETDARRLVDEVTAYLEEVST